MFSVSAKTVGIEHGEIFHRVCIHVAGEFARLKFYNLMIYY